MSEQEFNKIFAKNLSHYLELSDRTQTDLAKSVGVSTASVSNWCKGIKLPRMDKVDRICIFFSIKRSDLMEDKSIVDIHSSKSAAITQRPLSSEESTLLDDYQKLNAAGRSKVREYTSDLTEQKKYTEDTGSSASAAG